MEIQDVARGRSTPSVNGLQRITDSHHRMTHPVISIRAREEGGQQISLRRRCVLILVEKNDTVSGPQFLPDPWMMCDEVQGLQHAIAELDESALPFEIPVSLDQIE